MRIPPNGPAPDNRIIRITSHLWPRIRARSTYCANLSRARLNRLLMRAARHAPCYGEHVVIGKSYRRFLLPDGQPLTLVVADSTDGDRAIRHVITVLTDDLVAGCGTWIA